MGIVTPPGMEDFSWLFRILAMILLAIFLYQRLDKHDDDATAPVPVATQSSVDRPIETEVTAKEAPEEEKTLTRRMAERISRVTLPKPGADIESTEKAEASVSNTINAWLNKKIQEVTGTTEGRELMSALAERALTKKTGIGDNSLSAAQLTGRIYTHDIVKGTGDMAVCGSTVTFHMRVLSHTRMEAFNSEDIDTPISTVLGAGDILPGVAEAMRGMSTGGVRSAALPSTAAYENTGFDAPPVISIDEPMNAVITLLAVENGVPDAHMPDVLSTQYTSTSQQDDAAPVKPVGCGTKTELMLRLSTLPDEGTVTTYDIDAFVPGAKDNTLPLSLQAVIDKHRPGYTAKLRAKPESPTADYVNQVLYADAPRYDPAFLLALLPLEPIAPSQP